MKNSQTVKLGVIGLGARGMSLVQNLRNMEDVDITAICDLSEEKIEQCKQLLNEDNNAHVQGYQSYEALLEQGDIEGVIIATNWVSHVKIARSEERRVGKDGECE